MGGRHHILLACQFVSSQRFQGHALHIPPTCPTPCPPPTTSYSIPCLPVRISKCNAVLRTPPTHTCHVCVGLRAQARMHVHGERVQLRQALQAAQQQHHAAAPLHRLHRAGQQVGGQRLKILRSRLRGRREEAG